MIILLVAEVYPGEGMRGLPDDRVLQWAGKPVQGEVMVLSDYLGFVNDNCSLSEHIVEHLIIPFVLKIC